MARVNAAGATADTVALDGIEHAFSSPSRQRSQAVARWARIAVPVMILLVIVLVAAVYILQCVQERDVALSEAAAELEIIANSAASNLQVASAEIPEMQASALLTTALPAHALTHGRLALMANARGDVLAETPGSAQSGATLGDYLGPAQPLTILAEKAGVMRVTLPGGDDVLATVRTLRRPAGQIALVQNVADALGEWRLHVARSGVLLVCSLLSLALITWAYLWQSARSSAAQTTVATLRKRIDTALSRGRCGLWDWDIARGRIYWSTSMYEILETDSRPGYISCGDIDASIHPDDEKLSDVASRLASTNSGSVDYEFRIRNAHGEWLWLRARAELVRQSPGNSVHLIGIAVDITEQKSLAARTAAADARLRDAIETVSEAFVLWDAGNCLVMCNSKFQRLHNIPPECMSPGTPYETVMDRGMSPGIQSQTPVSSGPQTGARTYEARLADGRWLQVNERRTNDGGYVSVGTDITALKRHEEQLMDSERRLTATVADLRRSRLTLEQQARQLQELADRYLEQKAEAEGANRAKSEFLGNMSHELRTPLNAIIGFAEMMEQQTLGALGTPRYVEYCSDIRRSGQQLLGVISDVLDMSRLESGRFDLSKADFDFADVMAGAVESVRESAESKQITLTCESRAELFIHADRNALDKVLRSLLRNAVRFTPTGGEVQVRARAHDRTVEFSVEDTGIGIAREDVARLGRPFAQLSGQLENGNKGSGLGLAISRSLVELHGGAMKIRSTPGQGTTVRITLPEARSTAPGTLPLFRSSAGAAT